MAVGQAKFVIPTRSWPVSLAASNRSALSPVVGTGFLPLSGGTLTGNVLPNAGGSLDLGTSSLYWANVYTADIEVDDIESRASQDVVWINDDLDPKSGNTKDLGDSTLYWSSIYTRLFQVDEVRSRASATFVKLLDDWLPGSGGAYDLGDATFYWEVGYIDNILCDTIASRSGSSINFQDNIDMFTNHISLAEMTAPSGATNVARIYAVVNGSNTELRVIFQGDVDKLIATEAV